MAAPSAIAGLLSPNSDAAQSVVKVEVADGSGSGFYIGKGIVITANHVVEGVEDATITFDVGGEPFYGTVLWADKVHDIAAVQVAQAPTLGVGSLVCDYVPTIGDEVQAVGHPFGMNTVITFGRISTGYFSDPDIQQMWSEVVIADLTILPGSSGGALIKDGRIVGMTVGGLPPKVGSGLAYIVPSSTICASINAHTPTS